MHRQSSLWVQSGISQQAAMKSTGEPRPETEAAYLKRINSLEEIVRNLYQKLEAKVHGGSLSHTNSCRKRKLPN